MVSNEHTQLIEKQASMAPYLKRWGAVLGILTLIGAALRLVLLKQTPPGFHYDEAVYGLQALDVYHGHLPVYFSSYTGREPLYMYLIAIVFRVVGIGELGVRLTSALAGIATIPLVYLFMARITNRRVGLLAAGLTAVSFWHLLVSRNGYPNILIPPIECLSIFLLWRGYSDDEHSTRWRLGQFALGGAFLGLVLYTYLAARFFPITILLIFLYAMIVDWRRFRNRFWGLALAALVTVLVFAPLGLYFFRHPEDFVERANQVLIFQQMGTWDAIKLVLRNLGESFLGLFFQGDTRNHFNLSGKAILSPISGVFFVIGLAISLRHWRKPEYMLLPIWMLGMTLPAVLTIADMPQGQRMFGVIPALYGLVALGLDGTAKLIQKRIGTRPTRWCWVAPVLLVVVLVLEGVYTGHNYFGLWANRSETYYAFHADYTDMAERALEEMDQGNVPVIVSREYLHPGMVLDDERILDAVWVAGGRNMVIPNQAEDSIRYLWPVHSLQIDGAVDDVRLELTEEIDTIIDPDGETAVSVRVLKPGVMAREQSLPAVASFSGEIDLVNWDLPERARRDKPLRVLVHWRVAQPNQGHVLAMHLVDENGTRWSQSRKMGYFSENWHPGDSVYQGFDLNLPQGIPAGRYKVLLMLARQDDRLLPVMENGELTGVTYSLGTVTLKDDGAWVEPIADDATPITSSLQALQWTELDESAALGGTVRASVTWQAIAEIATDHQVMMELVDNSGQNAPMQIMPLGYQYPTHEWLPGEIVRAIYPISLQGLDPGDYAISLHVDGLPGTPALALGRVHIGGEERLFKVPPMEHVLSATMGQEIELLGYDLSESESGPGQEIALTLYWRGLAVPTGDYKVFVHLAAPDGTMAAQSDSVPAGWGRPTQGWVADEIIADTHQLLLPENAASGEYALYVGMYNADTLQRLMVSTEDERPADNRLPLGTITVDSSLHSE